MSNSTDDVLHSFWARARAAVPALPVEQPEAWAFGATPEHADELLELVLAGTKTATASALWDYEATGEPVPQPGELNIILDGAGRPRAVLENTEVTIVPFTEVTEVHARSEGEGDRSLRAWRETHERFWRNHAEHSENSRGFEPDMPVVCERFRLTYTEPAGRHPAAAQREERRQQAAPYVPVEDVEALLQELGADDAWAREIAADRTVVGVTDPWERAE